MKEPVKHFKKPKDAKTIIPDRNKKKQRVKTAKYRKISSTNWLKRQLNDPYVDKAVKLGVRGRAYFKIEEIDNKFKVIKKGGSIIDLGCAPGGWLQYSVKSKAKFVLGIDILETTPVEGAVIIQQDFLTENAVEKILSKMPDNKKADSVISDLAANTTGHKATDHMKTTMLVEKAYSFAKQVLNEDGCFVAKLFRGGAEDKLLNQLKKDFKIVKHFKPESSRRDSVEMYVIATGFKG